MKLWGGRFSGKMDPAAWELNASLGFDQRLAQQDVRGSLAWAQALGQAGVLTLAESEQISAGLQAILIEFAGRSFRVPGERRGHPHGGGAPAGRADRPGSRQAAHRAQPQRPGGDRPAPVAAGTPAQSWTLPWPTCKPP